MCVEMFLVDDNTIGVEFEELKAVFTINSKPLVNYFKTKEEIINCFKSFPINEIKDENVRKVIVNFTEEFFTIDGNKVSIEDTDTNSLGKKRAVCPIFCFESEINIYEGSPQTETSPEDPYRVDIYIKDGDINDNLKRISKEVCDFLQKQDVFKYKLINFEIEEVTVNEDELCEKLGENWIEMEAYY